MVKQYVMMASVLLWSGCIIAISFMESWLKFRAPGVTLPIGLGIGKMVFSALNKIEWFFAIVIIISCLSRQQIDAFSCTFFGITLCLLLLQTFWLLPALDARANIVISGKSVAASSLHWFFVAAEVFKLGSLITLGWRVFSLAVK